MRNERTGLLLPKHLTSHTRRRICLSFPGAVLGSLLATSSAMTQTPPLVPHSAPRTLPELTFKDEQGNDHKLSGLRGKTLVVNVWATWCLSCRTEMPSLSRLQALMSGEPLEVVALSVDRGGSRAVRRFYSDIGVTNLPIYIDATGKALRDLGGYGLPVTIVVGHDGTERARVTGPAEWDDPQIMKLLRALISNAAPGEQKEPYGSIGDGAQ